MLLLLFVTTGPTHSTRFHKRPTPVRRQRDFPTGSLLSSETEGRTDRGTPPSVSQSRGGLHFSLERSFTYTAHGLTETPPPVRLSLWWSSNSRTRVYRPRGRRTGTLSATTTVGRPTSGTASGPPGRGTGGRPVTTATGNSDTRHPASLTATGGV